MNRYTRALPKSLWWSAGSVVLMVVGAFGPWETVFGVFTVHGTDGLRDGWIVVAAACIAAVALLLHARAGRRRLVVLALIAGLVGAATAAYDINDIEGTGAGNDLFGDVDSAAWGVYVALVGSISLALSAIAFLIERRRETQAPSELPSGA